MFSRYVVLSDAQWELIAPLMPSSSGKAGRPFNDHRLATEGIIYRYRAGIPWRDLPPHFGAWQSVWKRHRRYSLDGTWDQVFAALLTRADAARLINWEVSADSTVNRAHQHGTNLSRHTGDQSNYKNLPTEPEDHAMGRSRGGLTTKIHALVDGNKRPSVLLLGPGPGGDAPMFERLSDALKIERDGSGRARIRPERAMADKAYSSKAIRTLLRERGIQSVIPEKEDQKANRKRKGASGGRSVTYDKEAYKRRNESRTQLQHPQAMAIHRNPLRQTRPNLPLGGSPASRSHLERSIGRHALVHADWSASPKQPRSDLSKPAKAKR